MNLPLEKYFCFSALLFHAWEIVTGAAAEVVAANLKMRNPAAVFNPTTTTAAAAAVVRVALGREVVEKKCVQTHFILFFMTFPANFPEPMSAGVFVCLAYPAKHFMSLESQKMPIDFS